MHHTNADSPSAGSPLRGTSLRPPQCPAGVPDEEPRAPAGQRARDSGRMPPAASSGYGQILAARAAMRQGLERATPVDPRDTAGLAPAPAGGKAGEPFRRGRPRRRRKGLVLGCVMAPPVCALFALALVGPQRSPSARVAEPSAPAAWTPPPRFAAAAIAAPVSAVAASDRSASAVQSLGASPWADGVELRAPRGNGPPDPLPGRVEPALAAWGPAVPSPAIDAGPSAPPERETPPSMLEWRAGSEEEEAAAGFVLAAGADGTPAAGSDGPGTNATGSGAAREAPPAQAPPASRFAVPAEVPPLPPWVRAEPAPGSPPAPRSPAAAAPAAAAPTTAAVAAPPAPAAPAVPDGVPPLPPWVRAAPEAPRAGASSPPAPAARAAEGGGSPAAEARCRAIVVKLQLGEDVSHAERAYLQTSCGARRR